jgi:hypothetical protein
MDLHFLIFLFPVGVVMILRTLRDVHIFMITTCGRYQPFGSRYNDGHLMLTLALAASASYGPRRA